MSRVSVYEWRPLLTREISSNSTADPLNAHASQLVGHKVFVFGGYLLSTHTTSRLMCVLDIGKQTWEIPKIKYPPTPRLFHNMKLINDELYIYGGSSLTDMYSINVVTFDCKAVQQVISTAFDYGLEATRKLTFGQSVEYFERDHSLVMFGGNFSNSRVQTFDLSSKKWSLDEAKGQAPTARKFHSSCIHQNRLFISGGFGIHDTYFNDFFVLTLPRCTIAFWTRLSPHNANSHGFAYAPMVYYENCLIIYGGFLTHSRTTREVLSFELASMQLTRVPSTNTLGAFESQACHTITLLSSTTTRHRLLVLGGLCGEPGVPSRALKECAEICLNYS